MKNKYVHGRNENENGNDTGNDNENNGTQLMMNKIACQKYN